MQAFQIVEHWLPPLSDEVPEELQDVEEEVAPEAEETESETEPVLARKTRAMKMREAEAGVSRSTSVEEVDSELEIDEGKSSQREQSPSQVKVKKEMVARTRQTTLLETGLSRSLVPEMQPPPHITIGLKKIPVSK